MAGLTPGQPVCGACIAGGTAQGPDRSDEPVAVVLRPQTEYAGRLIEQLWRGHGVRSLAVSHRWRDRIALEPGFPLLRSPAVAASYVIGGGDPVSAVVRLARAHRIVAVVPHHERTLVPLAAAADRLGLDWAQPGTLQLFRDKAALKERVRSRAPHVRLNGSAVARSPLDVLDLADQWGADRIVLKPNDGVGSEQVAFLDRPFPARAIAQSFLAAEGARGSAGQVLVEEFIGGREYFVNGQMDHRGEPLVLSVRRYSKGSANGRENVSLGARAVRTHEPEFAELAVYAEDVMRATGLRRCPFHMEIKIDERGPCLIEVAARLVGQSGAVLDSFTSGVDVFGLAAHYFLHDSAHPGPGPDWRRNDALSVAHVTGVNFGRGRIERLAGVAQVEAMPEFLAWSRRPRLGDRLRPTVDVETLPWSLLLSAGSDEALGRAEAVARGMIRWNDDAPGPRRSRADRLVLLAAIRARRLWRVRPRRWLLGTRRPPRPAAAR